MPHLALKSASAPAATAIAAGAFAQKPEAGSAAKVVPICHVMGPVQAALEANGRCLAHELGARGLHVNAISPGPMKTRVASGLKDFDPLLAEAEQRAADASAVASA
jgi:enoyl-[acyl-carrier-protein] reductase (NADH)